MASSSTTIQTWISKPFQFDDITILPIEVPEFDSTYILTCWNSNIYIKICEDNTFKIIEVLGENIVKDQDYILIRPSY